MSDQERIDEYLRLNPIPQYIKHCKGKGSEWKKGNHNRNDGHVVKVKAIKKGE